MNQIPNDRLADVPWPTSSNRMPAPDHSALPGNHTPQPGATGMLKNAVQGAHDTLDRLSDRATPAVQRLGDSVHSAEATLRAKTSQLREKGDEWVDGTRSSIRKHPLTAVAIAVAVGALVARLTRR
ncbi:MAG: hypothetical protein RL227_944 [Pseudomonadota bacterium]|jgi:ElaB/YqjD/DUF883 family membrane-anchored ribosome-binding protein